jgi:hypothetical protein
MSNYRVYYQNEENHIIGVDTLSADDDTSAIALVEQLCERHRHSGSVELWYLSRQVHTYRVLERT